MSILIYFLFSLSQICFFFHVCDRISKQVVVNSATNDCGVVYVVIELKIASENIFFSKLTSWTFGCLWLHRRPLCTAVCPKLKLIWNTLIRKQAPINFIELVAIKSAVSIMNNLKQIKVCAVFYQVRKILSLKFSIHQFSSKKITLTEDYILHRSLYSRHLDYNAPTKYTVLRVSQCKTNLPFIQQIVVGLRIYILCNICVPMLHGN